MGNDQTAGGIKAKLWHLTFSCHLALLPTAAVADEVYLKSSDRISGNILSVTTEQCTIRTSYDATIKIPLDQIERLSTTEPVMLRLKSGEQLSGTITLEKHGKIAVASEQLGDFKLDMDNIEAISAPSLFPPYGQELSLSALSVRAKGSETMTLAQRSSTEPEANSEAKPEERLGEESKQDLGPQFLRQGTVLLEPGEFQMEFALSYIRDQFLNRLARQGSFTTAFRFGLPLRTEGYVNVPASYRTNEFFFEDGTSFKDEETGLGDVSGGFNFVLAREARKRPEFILQLGFRAPTGEEPDLLDVRQVTLGSGRWAGSLGLNMVRSYDPAVVFGGFSLEYLADATIDDIDVSGAHRLTYNFGTGFAVNNQITLSARFIGIYQTVTKYNGEELTGSDVEPMNLRLSSTYRFSNKQYLEPSVRFGLNDEAIDTVINLSYFFNF